MLDGGAQRRPTTWFGVSQHWLSPTISQPPPCNSVPACGCASQFELLHAGGPRGSGWGGVKEGVTLGQSRDTAAREFIEEVVLVSLRLALILTPKDAES